jgi:RsiW-degrading membrane proteinase PrsW (M82 family)
MPVQPTPEGWKLRVLSGRMLGTEFDLPNSRYVLGSQQPSDIVIAHPDIAPRHVTIELRPDGVHLTDCGGRGLIVNGRPVRTAQVAPGDRVEVGPLKFEFSNPNYRPPARSTNEDSFWATIEKLPLWVRVGPVMAVIALLLFGLLICSGAPTLVPITLFAMSVVVPVTVICYLLQYDTRGISFHTLAITFLAGGTVGVIAAMFVFLAGELTIGLLTLAIFAGVAEEPGKLLGTAWRWRHPGYDRPMDGLLLGTVSGFGFAVIETAGYGFTVMMEGMKIHDQGIDLDYLGMMGLIVQRSLMSPFAHGLWSGILAAGFWATGRNWGRAVRSKEFWASVGLAIGLHGLWNSYALVLKLLKDLGGLGLILSFVPLLASAALSVIVYRQLLLKKGYLTLDRSFWRR